MNAIEMSKTSNADVMGSKFKIVVRKTEVRK
jgi:hypothetical protein